MAGSVSNVWIFVCALLVLAHLGLARCPGLLFVTCAAAALAGFALVPSATVVSVFLLLWVVALPWICLAHVGLFGVKGMFACGVYWLVTAAMGRWEANIRKNDKAIVPGIRSSRFWILLASYFPSQLHMDSPLPEADGPYLFAIHPHGVWSASVWSNMIPEHDKSPLPRRRICTLDVNFNIPIIRDFLFAMGLISSSSTAISDTLAARISVGLVVGGGREALLARPGALDLVLNKRRGFVRLALQAGASLVPVLTFGETALYSPGGGAAIWNPMNQLLLKVCGMSLPIIAGRFGTFLPNAVPLTTVVGQPLHVERVAHPSAEQIEDLHGRYCKHLEELYAKHKDTFDKQRTQDMRIVG